jgi:hypothetical protein
MMTIGRCLAQEYPSGCVPSSSLPRHEQELGASPPSKGLEGRSAIRGEVQHEPEERDITHDRLIHYQFQEGTPKIRWQRLKRHESVRNRLQVSTITGPVRNRYHSAG